MPEKKLPKNRLNPKKLEQSSDKDKSHIENINLGKSLFEKGEYDAAVEFHKKAIELNPDDVLYHNNLGHAYKFKGIKKQAEEYFQKAEEFKN